MTGITIRERKYGYWLNAVIAFDQFVAALCGYNTDVTISAAIGESMWENGGTVPKKQLLKKYINKYLEKAEKNHCLISYAVELECRNMKVPEELYLLIGR